MPWGNKFPDLKNDPTYLEGRVSNAESSLTQKANQSDVVLKADKTYVDTQIGAVASGSPKGVYTTLPQLQSAFPTGNSNIYLVTGNVKEVETLNITAAPTASGNVTVTLNGVATNISVTAGVAEVASLAISAIPTVAGNITVTLNGVATNIAVDPATDTTTDLVATKIRNTAFSGWTTGGTGSTVIFTATSVGVKTDATYSAGSTGATGTMSTTTQGVAADDASGVATKIRNTSFSGWTTGGTGTTVTFTKTTAGTNTAPSYSAGSTGSTGTMSVTTAGVNVDGNWYYWNGSAWIAGGVYQATGLANGSVYPIHEATTVVPKIKDSTLYTSLSNTTSLYVPNEAALQKGVVNLIGKFGAGTVDFFLLKKSGTVFTVVKKFTQTLTSGVNTVLTGFIAEGTGDEYIGFRGPVNFRSTGGQGMWECVNADMTATVFNAPVAMSSGNPTTIEFSVYPTFGHQGIADKISSVNSDLSTKITNVDNKFALQVGNLGQTIIKDLPTYTTGALYKIYIPNTALGAGSLTVHFQGAVAESADFYVLQKNGTTFTVKKKVTLNLTLGENIIDMGYIAVGDGSEYVGYYAHSNYKQTGGTGMYEIDGTTYNEADSFIPKDSTSGTSATFDFGIYYEFKNQSLQNAVSQLQDDVQSLKQDVVLTSPAAQTVAKDFSLYTSTGTYKIYIPNVQLGSGYLKIHYKGNQTETVPFYILVKNGTSFIIKKVLSVNLIAGENIIDTGYTCKGDGTEYVGFFAHNYFKQTGGTGMYEMTGATYSEGQTISPQDSTTGAGAAFDFAIYYEYIAINTSLTQSVAQLQSDVDSLKNNSTTAPASTVALTDYLLPHYSELSGQSIGYIGRWFDKTINGTPCKVTINEGSEFYFKVKGTVNISVNFQLITSLATPYFAYSIDGAALTRQIITNPNLPTVDTGEHIVRIVCDGLTETEDKWNGEIGFAVSGVTVDAGATLTGILPKNRTIIFFGDSITEGIRVLNMNADSTGNSGSGAYPYVTCQNLNAISYRVGFGATGVTKSGSGGVPACLQYIDNMTATRPTPYFEPDLIVINHGTNDAGATSATFKSAYNAVLDRLKLKYPGVPIFPMIPFNQAHAQDIRDCVAGRTYCYLVETAGWGVTFTDGTHPDVNGGITAGGKLAAQIHNVMGTSYFIK